MNSEQALLKYTNAVDAVKDHIEKNKSIFDAHERLVFQVIDAENELRDAVAASGQGVQNGSHKVTFEKQTQTIFDEDKMKCYLSAEEMQKVTTVNERPPRITINEIKI